MNEPHKYDLIGDAPAAEPAQQALKSAPGKVTRSPLQREFERLVAGIEAADKALVTWEAVPQKISAKYDKELAPALDALIEQKKRLVVMIDSLLTSAPKGLRMTARRRKGLAACLLDLLDAICAQEVLDDTLIAIRARYDESPYAPNPDEQDAQEQEAEIIALFEEMFGRGSLEREPGESHDDFIARARSRLQEALDREDERRRIAEEKRDAKRRAKADRASVKKNSGQQPGDVNPLDGQATKADPLRALYRRLASALHPDRESDPVLKAEKTAAMQGLNTAYENKDMLSLLKQHHGMLQGAPDMITAFAEDTLRDYNAILKAQLKAKKNEIRRVIEQVTPPVVAINHGLPRTPSDLELMMSRDISAIRRMAAEIATTIVELDDPARRTQAVNDLVESAEAEEAMSALDDLMRYP
jgi:hypothetical protein